MAGTCVWGSVCVCGGGGSSYVFCDDTCLSYLMYLLAHFTPVMSVGRVDTGVALSLCYLTLHLTFDYVPPTPGREQGLRIVEVPASEVHNLVDIARGCARYPRVHFILVVDHLELPLRGAGSADLMGALAAAGGCSEGGVGGWGASVCRRAVSDL
jgi:hypothetical protein